MKNESNKICDPNDYQLFALSSGISCIIFAYHICQSWHFPWYGNPDQDLVFLRDGLRIARLETPGYSDHPGLLQMLVGALSHLAWGTAAKINLNDADWQRIFELQKIFNSAAMALLIGLTSVLLRKLTNRTQLALLTGITCALSIGTTTLEYQLRNEFFSAYLFYAAALIAAGIANNRIKDTAHIGADRKISLAPMASYSLLAMLSLLSKVQVLPLLALLSLGLAGWIYGYDPSGLKKFAKILCKAIVLSATLLTIFRIASIDIGVNFIAAISVLTLAVTPLYIAATANTEKPDNYSKEERSITLTFGAASLGYAAVAHINHWQHISWNPYSASKYTSPPINGNGSAEFLSNAGDAYALLFERTFDGQLFAHILAILVPLLIIGLFFNPKTNRPQIHKQSPKEHLTDLSGAYLFACAIAMSTIVSFRWPVDHYLPYQQPLLILSILAIGTAPRSRLIWKSTAIYMVTSALLLNLSYPRSAYATYVKNTISVNFAQANSQATNNSKTSALCASQHAGREWKGSIIGWSCRY